MARKRQNCYIYTRVSTEMQVDGYSLEAQKERLRSEGRKQLLENLDHIFVLAKALNYKIEDQTGQIDPSKL